MMRGCFGIAYKARFRSVSVEGNCVGGGDAFMGNSTLCCYGCPVWVMVVECDCMYCLELGGVSGGGGVGLGVALGVVFVSVG